MFYLAVVGSGKKIKEGTIVCDGAAACRKSTVRALYQVFSTGSSGCSLL